MTKKSAGRIQRDLQAAQHKDAVQNNESWTELQNVFQGCAQVLSSHENLMVLLKDEELKTFLDDPEATSARLRALVRDILQLNQELSSIHEEHAGRSGNATEEEMVLTFQIVEKYHLFMQRHDAVAMRSATELIEQFANAEIKRENFRRKNRPTAESLAQDPNSTAVIDVEVREPAPKTEA